MGEDSYEVSVHQPLQLMQTVYKHNPLLWKTFYRRQAWGKREPLSCGWRTFYYSDKFIIDELLFHHPEHMRPIIPIQPFFDIGHKGVLCWFDCFCVIGTRRTFRFEKESRFSIRYYRRKLWEYKPKPYNTCNITFYTQDLGFSLQFKLAVDGEDGWCRQRIRFMFSKLEPIRASVTCYVPKDEQIIILDAFRYLDYDHNDEYCLVYSDVLMRFKFPETVNWLLDKITYKLFLAVVGTTLIMTVVCSNLGLVAGILMRPRSVLKSLTRSSRPSRSRSSCRSRRDSCSRSCTALSI